MVKILWKIIGIVEKCRKSVAANTQRKALKILVVSIVSIVESNVPNASSFLRKKHNKPIEEKQNGYMTHTF